ncbi:unnamed protein product [Psylliodes chrysocephalus]|uniref:Polycystic kidney disease 2-like 1 protein n=1 Tax=Psylliodes chrysocephalus TaxID=3402493 RepID=A0A9P0G978_9CUCU|nr:unnamed protein product [Psylliodes chrysocephala]
MADDASDDKNEIKDEEKVVKHRKENKAKNKKTFWVTKSIAEELGREAVLRRTLIEFVIYVVFLIFSTLYIIGINTTSVYYLTKALKQQFVEQEFETLNGVGISFGDIKTAVDVWFYLENHLSNSLFWESTYDPRPGVENAMNILHENKVLGVPRLRQVKVRNDSCIIHSYFRRLFLTCFDSFSSSSEDVEPFGPRNKTAWVYSSSKQTKSLPYRGEISTYNGGGYYVNLSRNKSKTIQLIQDLKDNLWITRGTRAILIDFNVYNGNLNLFGICKLIFEFPTLGGVIPSAKVHTVRLLRFHTTFDWFILACQCSCYFFIIFYLFEELREMIYFKFAYLFKFWNYIDLLIITLFVVALILSILLILQVPDALNEIRNFPDEYGNLEYVTEIYKKHNDVVAIALYLIYLKAFKFLNFNKTMSQLNDTLSNCVVDILGFSLMFFIIFFAYAELGYLLFGNQVEGFSSFNIAMFTLLRTILGDFDYQEIEEANRILAPIYFLSYIFLVFFVLLNMFLAIISDTYADVKTEIAVAPNEMHMLEYIQKHFGRILRKMGCGKFLPKQSDIKSEINANVRDIRDVLKKCGYSDLEIEMFFARYNISPLAEMHVKDSDKLLAELKNILNHDTSKDNNFVNLKDFISQQERLKDIEKTIGQLVRHLKEILMKLETMENVTKKKKHV